MKMNESLVRRRSEWYISAVLARYLPQDHHIEIAGGGNVGALHFSHADMNLREYTFGVAAGVDSDAEFFMSKIPVQTGDIVCLYTDGVYCARKRNGDPFGKSDLADTVRKIIFWGGRSCTKDSRGVAGKGRSLGGWRRQNRTGSEIE